MGDRYEKRSPLWKPSARFYLADPARAVQIDAAVYRHIREITWLTFAMVAIGIPFVLQYALLGVVWMAASVLLAITIGLVNLFLLRRTAHPLQHGVVGVCAISGLLLVSNLASGGFYDPNFGWLYFIPIMTSFGVNPRAGAIATVVVLVTTIIFWFGAEQGWSPQALIPLQQHAQQSLLNRVSAVIGIGAMLGALANQHAFQQQLLRKVNQELSTQMEHQAELSARLLQTERLASMGNVAANIAHEVNNPLAAIKLNLEILLRDKKAGLYAVGDDGERERDEELETLGESLAAAKRVEKIIDALRTFGLAGDGSSTTSSVSAACTLAARLVEPVPTDQAAIAIRVAEDCGAAEIGQADLVQVLFALLSNARYASQALPSERSKIELRAFRKQERVVIEVEDQGVGIPPHLQKRVFEPFFTTKELGQGPGLGLSVALNLVEHAGGAISLVSDENRRTLVRVELPVAETSAG